MCGGSEFPDQEGIPLSAPTPRQEQVLLDVCCLSTLFLSELPIYGLQGVGKAPQGVEPVNPLSAVAPCLPVVLLMMDDSLGVIFAMLDHRGV